MDFSKLWRQMSSLAEAHSSRRNAMPQYMLDPVIRELVGASPKNLFAALDAARGLNERNTDADAFALALSDFALNWCKSPRQPVQYLRRLYEAETITVRATMGTNIHNKLIRARKVFAGYIDPDCENWGLISASIDRPATNVVVEELVRDGKFLDFYGTDVDELNRRRMDWDTMVQFCEDHPDKLRTDGYATFFLLTKGGKPVETDLSNVFVASVRWGDFGRLRVYVSRLGNVGVWSAEFRHRFVVPQLVA